MPKQSIALLTLSVVAAEALLAHRFVAPGGTQAGAGVNTLGVAPDAAALGDTAAVEVLGTTIVEAGAAIAADAVIQADADGRAITKDAGVTVARMAPGAVAAAAGDLVEVILIPN